MSERAERPLFPPAATCEQLRDYFEWHVQNGRGKYIPEMRCHYFALPSTQDTHDDETQTVFVEGVY